MKKINVHFYTILFVLLVSCTKIDYTEDLALDIKSSNPKYNVSLLNVKQLLSVVDKNSDINIESITPLTHNFDTLIYVVNYSNDLGWKIIAADKRINPILALDSTGSFKIDNLGPGIFIWLDDLANRISQLKIYGLEDSTCIDFVFWQKLEELNDFTSGKSFAYIPPEGGGYWQLINVTTTPMPSQQVGPLLPTKWGQGIPWNTCVPYTSQSLTERCPTGCVAVAGAQMLYYLNHTINKPTSMFSTGECWGWSINDGDFLTTGYYYGFSFSNKTSLAWSNMPLAYDLPIDNYHSVGILMGYIGMKIDMSYGVNGSGAKMNKLVDYFRFEGITCSNNVDYNSSTVISNLNSNRPVVISADRFDGWATWLGINWYKKYKGHAWVIDGYERRTTKYTYTYEWVIDDGMAPYKKSSKTLIGEQRIEEYYSSVNYLIMNWGYDGYYDTGRYTLTGDWTTSSNRNYIYDRKMIYNFN